MITAIDTNVLLDVLIPNEKFFEPSLQAMEKVAGEGSLVVCDAVYAELSAQFTTQRACDEFVESNEIRVEPLSRSALFLAGRIWLSYRRQGGSRPGPGNPHPARSGFEKISGNENVSEQRADWHVDCRAGH